MATKEENKVFRARLKNLRVSPLKLKLLADLIRGQSAQLAIQNLKFSSKKMSLEIAKMVESAVNNASQDPSVNIDKLYVKRVFVDQATTLKRFRARARGSGTRILKRMSHITVELDQKI